MLVDSKLIASSVTSSAGDAAPAAGDVDVSAGDVHRQSAGYVILLLIIYINYYHRINIVLPIVREMKM